MACVLYLLQQTLVRLNPYQDSCSALVWTFDSRLTSKLLLGMSLDPMPCASYGHSDPYGLLLCMPGGFVWILGCILGFIWILGLVWILGLIWIVIVHARRHQGPAWHSRHLLSTLSAPGQSWAPEFYGASS